MGREKTFDELALIVDVETVAIPDASEYLESATAPSNYKDATKIATYIADKNAERLANASLDIDLCRLVAIGYMVERHDLEPRVIVCPDEHAERRALEELWNLIAIAGNATRPIVGFNSFSFDLPLLMRRSLYLDLW